MDTLLMQQLAHSEVSGIAAQRNEPAKTLRSRFVGYNRATEKVKTTQ